VPIPIEVKQPPSRLVNAIVPLPAGPHPNIRPGTGGSLTNSLNSEPIPWAKRSDLYDQESCAHAGASAAEVIAPPATATA